MQVTLVEPKDAPEKTTEWGRTIIISPSAVAVAIASGNCTSALPDPRFILFVFDPQGGKFLKLTAEKDELFQTLSCALETMTALLFQHAIGLPETP